MPPGHPGAARTLQSSELTIPSTNMDCLLWAGNGAALGIYANAGWGQGGVGVARGLRGIY